MIKNINILQSHAFKALIKARKKVFAASVAAAVRSGPHGIARLGADYHFIAVGSHLLSENPAEILFGAAGRRTVIIG